MDNDNIEIGSKQLDDLTAVCDTADQFLTVLGDSEEPQGSRLCETVAQLSLVLTESRRAIKLVGADLTTLKTDRAGKTIDLESTKTTLSLLRLSYRAHRGMLEKIVRMKTAAGGRNTEAALAAESFLAQNPAI